MRFEAERIISRFSANGNIHFEKLTAYIHILLGSVAASVSASRLNSIVCLLFAYGFSFLFVVHVWSKFTHIH